MDNQQAYLQEIKEEADFLRKRTWDFIDKLEKLEKQRKNSRDADKRQKLQVRIDNTRHLLEDYKIQYKNICKEAGLKQNNLSVTAPSYDSISNAGRKTEKTLNKLKSGESIDLPPFFTLVPSRNPKFTGRKDEVRNFIQQVIEGNAFSICGVKGMGGIGKTEIAKEVCHLFHQTWQKQPQIPEYVSDLLITDEKKDGFFRDGILWIQFEPENQTPLVLTEYIIPKLTNDPKIIEKITDLKKLSEVLADKDILVVLDSVEQNLRTFDYVLERFKGKFPIIITSRIAIPGIHAIDIDVLPEKDAEELFIRSLNNTDRLSNEQTKTISELCKILGHYPLIIERIAALVNDDKSNLGELKEEFSNNRKALLATSSFESNIDSKHIDTSTCFMMSLNSLGDIDKEVFLHSSLFDNPFTTRDLAGLIRNENENEVQQIIIHLLHKSVISQSKNQEKQKTTYYLHPLMREFALDLLMKKVEIDENKSSEVNSLLKTLNQKKKEQKLLKELQVNKNLVQQALDAMKYCDQVFNFKTVIDFANILNATIDKLGYFDDKIILNKLAIHASVGLQTPKDELHWKVQYIQTLDDKATTKNENEYVYKSWKDALSLSQELNQKEDILFIQYRLLCTEKVLHLFNILRANVFQRIRTTNENDNTYWLGSIINLCANPLYTDDVSIRTDRINFKIKIKTPIEESWQRNNLLITGKNCIISLFNQGKAEESLSYFKKLLKLSEQTNNKTHIMSEIENILDCYLYIQDINACEKYLKDYIKLNSEFGLSKYKTHIFKGQLAWLKEDYIEAEDFFKLAIKSSDLEKHTHQYWLGKVYLYNGELDKADSFLNKALDYHYEQNNPVEVAKIYSQFALLCLKRNDTQEAIKILNISLKTQKIHGIKISPEEEKIKNAIYKQFIDEGGDDKQYKALTKKAELIDLIPDFILPELAKTYIGKDNKTMLLIPEGSTFIGKGKIETPSTKELLDNIKTYLFPYKHHNKKYKIPVHPKTTFDEDKLLFLLEKTQSIKEEEKQQTIDRIVNQESEIYEFINELDKEFHEINLKATETYLYPYYMDRDPVSNIEYQAFCLASGHSSPDHWIDGIIPEKTESLPVVNITLKDAKAYAKWANKKIPTAAEWEKACRGEEGYLYPWGDDWDDSKIITKDGAIRRKFEAEYLKLNATIPDSGGFIHFPSPRFTMPSTDLECDDVEEWLSYLEGSISLTIQEKQAIIAALPQITQIQFDGLIRILKKEKDQFNALDKKHDEELNKLRKKHYIQLMHDDLLDHYRNSLLDSTYNMHGDNTNLTKTLKQLEETYLDLNSTIPEKGGLIHFPTPRFQIPPHELDCDNEAEWLSYLEGSLSLTAEEKHKVIESLPKLDQFQFDELFRILKEEKSKFMDMNESHLEELNKIRRKHYFELLQPELSKLYQYTDLTSVQINNKSIYGIHNLVGCIYNFTSTNNNEGIVIKGGSWFSENPQESAKAWYEKVIATDLTNMSGDGQQFDIGFRCVIPIFSKEDIEVDMLA